MEWLLIIKYEYFLLLTDIGQDCREFLPFKGIKDPILLLGRMLPLARFWVTFGNTSFFSLIFFDFVRFFLLDTTLSFITSLEIKHSWKCNGGTMGSRYKYWSLTERNLLFKGSSCLWCTLLNFARKLFSLSKLLDTLHTSSAVL